MTEPEFLERNFPRLKDAGYEITSPADGRYNCIAWAAGTTANWWWPTVDGYWPKDAPREETLSAFIAAYQTLGYEVCESGEPEEGIEKIAIYAVGSKPTHAARQLGEGGWTSKCGRSVDISHQIPEAISNSAYGDVAVFMSRPQQNA